MNFSKVNLPSQSAGFLVKRMTVSPLLLAEELELVF